MTNADIDITTTFDYDTGKVSITDNADYTTLNVDTTAIKGLGILTDPLSSTVFTRLTTAVPLINLGAGATESSDFNLPLNSDDAIVNGTYTMIYTVNAPYNYVGIHIEEVLGSPDNAIIIIGDFSYLAVGDSVTISGSTLSNNQTLTISAIVVVPGSLTSVEDDVYTITLTGGVLVDEVSTALRLAFNVTRTYSKTYTYAYSGCDQLTPDIAITSDCESGQYGTITLTDSTTLDGQTIVSRVLQLYRPSGLPDHPSGVTPSDPIVSTSSATSSITTSKLATGTWTGKLVATYSITGDDGLVTTYSTTYPTNSVQSTVTCSTGMCDLDSCISNFWTDYSACGSPTDAQKNQATKLGFLLGAYANAKSCSDSDNMATYKAGIVDVLDSDCGCAESADLPAWVDNLGEIINECCVELIYSTGGRINTPAGFAAIGEITIPHRWFDAVGPMVQIELYAFGTDAANTINILDANTGTTIYQWEIGTNYGKLTLWLNQLAGVTNRTANIMVLQPTAGMTVYASSTASVWDLDDDLVLTIQPSNTSQVVYNQLIITGLSTSSTTA